MRRVGLLCSGSGWFHHTPALLRPALPHTPQGSAVGLAAPPPPPPIQPLTFYLFINVQNQAKDVENALSLARHNARVSTARATRGGHVGNG